MVAVAVAVAVDGPAVVVEQHIIRAENSSVTAVIPVQILVQQVLLEARLLRLRKQMVLYKFLGHRHQMLQLSAVRYLEILVQQFHGPVTALQAQQARQ
jgi:hypothetical protein